MGTIIANNMIVLTHFMPLIFLNTPGKIEKSKFFDVFKGVYNQISVMKWVRLTKTCLGKSEKAAVPKHFQRTNCLNVFDHFMGLVLEGLSVITSIYISYHHDPWCRAAIG